MQAKATILYLWHKAVMAGVGVTFANVYGETTGKERYFETCDAWSRDDAVRIVKSIIDLCNDTPLGAHTYNWPAHDEVWLLYKHRDDDDYPATQRVPSSTRDPNINMHSEPVTRDNVLDDVEPCDDAWNYANLKDTL